MIPAEAMPLVHASARRFAGVLAATALAAYLVSLPAWPDAALDARLKNLETQLRCLVCQNQTLAESNAPLAEDLRKEVRELAAAGKSDDEIRGYLVARYGDFVLYKPPVKPTTYLLWFGPFLLLGGGAIVWIAILRRRARMRGGADVLADAASGGDASVALARARELLDE